jgi:hypothetical protein
LAFVFVAGSPAEARRHGGGLAAGAIFGAAAGMMLGAAAAQQPRRPAYVVEPRTRRVCDWRVRYDRWGYEVGRRRVCWVEEY